MTRRRWQSELERLPKSTPDPFAGCCWPSCTSLPYKSDFFCAVHGPQVPEAIDKALHGAVVEVNLEAWRRACQELRVLAAVSAHG